MNFGADSIGLEFAYIFYIFLYIIEYSQDIVTY